VRAHEAGALHGDLGSRGPAWLRTPADVNALLPHLWARTVTRAGDGVLAVGGLSVRDLADRFGTPAYVLDEEDLRARCREFAQAFGGDADGAAPRWEVFYAGKAFLCRAVVRVIAEEGLSLDVCSGGELTTALAAGMPPERIGFHGNNKSVAELTRAVDAGVGRIILDSDQEIDRLTAIARARPGCRPPVMVRVTVGVEAHTHEFIATAHEDQKFGFSLAGGAAFAAATRVLDEDVLELRGLHSHIGSQIFDTSGFEVSARRVLALQARIRDARGVEPPELDLGGGFGMAYTTQEVGTVKDVDGIRSYVSVDGGMSDNIRTALYDASYSATVASRASPADPILARVVGKHCEAGDVVVKDEFLPADVRPGDLLAVPGTGAYCRSMASNYNHLPRPPVVAVRDGRARVIVRRETEDDLLTLDVG
jgi:diaminopimelate decarboxylase